MPRAADRDWTWLTDKYGVSKTHGGDAWADVWKKELKTPPTELNRRLA